MQYITEEKFRSLQTAESDQHGVADQNEERVDHHGHSSTDLNDQRRRNVYRAERRRVACGKKHNLTGGGVVGHQSAEGEGKGTELTRRSKEPRKKINLLRKGKNGTRNGSEMER